MNSVYRFSKLLLEAKVLCVLLVLGFTTASFAFHIRIRVFTNTKIQTLQFKAANGQYNIFADRKKITTCTGKEILTISMSNGVLSLKKDTVVLGVFLHIQCKALTSDAVSRIKPVEPSLYEQDFAADMGFSVQDGNIKLINHLDIEDYLPSVVVSEAGNVNVPEYLKTQAIVSRTYAENSLGRHIADGYDVCDQVHCQVYKGVYRASGPIMDAVYATKGIVVVDSAMHLIDAAFSANSGGETANAADVWKDSVSYLVSVNDPYSLSGAKARWQLRITIAKWRDYLLKKAAQSTTTGAVTFDESFDYISMHRTPNYTYQSVSIPFKDIRADWKLNSAYFSITTNGDDLVLNGLGNGHGVGLSQDGALQMARQGKSCDEIIRFYYRGVLLSTIDEVEFLEDYY
jgi:stage II sporulation protein D